MQYICPYQFSDDREEDNDGGHVTGDFSEAGDEGCDEDNCDRRRDLGERLQVLSYPYC